MGDSPPKESSSCKETSKARGQNHWKQTLHRTKSKGKEERVTKRKITKVEKQKDKTGRDLTMGRAVLKASRRLSLLSALPMSV